MPTSGRFQLANLAAIRKYPITPYRDVTSRALGSVSRAYYDPASKKIYAAFNYPGVVAHVGAIDIESGAVQRIMPIKGPVIYTVTSLAWDPDARALFYTTDNGSFRDLVQLDPATGKTRMLQKDARIGDIVFSKSDKALWGLRHLNGFVTIVRIPAPYTSWEQIVTLPYGTIAYDLDVSPDGTKLVASFGEITGAQDVRVLSIEALEEARHHAAGAVRLRAVGAERLHLFRRWPLPLRQLVSARASPTSFATSSRAARSKRSATPTPDFSVRCRSAATTCWCSGTPAAASSPPASPPSRSPTSSPITFLGERLAADHPVVRSWNVGSPLVIPYDTLDKRQQPYRLFGGLRPESFYPIVQGYKDTAAVGMRLNLSDRIRLNRASVAASFAPIADLPAQ